MVLEAYIRNKRKRRKLTYLVGRRGFRIDIDTDKG